MNIVLRAAVAYWILLFALRLIGRKTASQMAPFDLIMLFLFGGSAITSVLGADQSRTAAYTTICTIGIMHLSVSWAKARSIRIERMIMEPLSSSMRRASGTSGGCGCRSRTS